MKNLAGRDLRQQLLGVEHRAEKAKTHEKIRILRPRRVLIETEECDLRKMGFPLGSLSLSKCCHRPFFLPPPFMKGLFRYIVLHCSIPPSTCLSSSTVLECLLPSLQLSDFLGIKRTFPTVQGSSPHKCGQEISCNAFNAVVAAFP